MDIELLEGRIHGARYYTAKPLFEWWEQHNRMNNTWRDMIEWCVVTYGPANELGVWEPNGRWYANNAKFWFRSEEDRTMFVLRWQ